MTPHIIILSLFLSLSLRVLCVRLRGSVVATGASDRTIRYGTVCVCVCVCVYIHKSTLCKLFIVCFQNMELGEWPVYAGAEWTLC